MDYCLLKMKNILYPSNKRLLGSSLDDVRADNVINAIHQAIFPCLQQCIRIYGSEMMDKMMLIPFDNRGANNGSGRQGRPKFQMDEKLVYPCRLFFKY